MKLGLRYLPFLGFNIIILLIVINIWLNLRDLIKSVMNIIILDISALFIISIIIVMIICIVEDIKGDLNAEV